MNIENLLERVTDEMLELAIKKKYNMFFILIAVAKIPDKKFSTRSSIKNNCTLPEETLSMITPVGICRAATKKYLEVDSALKHRVNKCLLYGPLMRKTHSVYRISDKGFFQLEMYVDDLEAQIKIKNPYESKNVHEENLRNVIKTLNTFFQAIEKIDSLDEIKQIATAAKKELTELRN